MYAATTTNHLCVCCDVTEVMVFHLFNKIMVFYYLKIKVIVFYCYLEKSSVYVTNVTGMKISGPNSVCL